MDAELPHPDEESNADNFDYTAYHEQYKDNEVTVDQPPAFIPGSHLELAAISDFAAPQDMDDTSKMQTSVDYIYRLVPDLLQIINFPFYWGKMNRSEAEELLENKPDGTYLLRDSAQEENLFSISFRKYGKSLHSRMEQWNHLFSFDLTYPDDIASSSVFGLIEQYKDSEFGILIEPLLTKPLQRNFIISLQHMCRATICSNVTYDDVNHLDIPIRLKTFLKEYHYKERIKIIPFDLDAYEH